MFQTIAVLSFLAGSSTLVAQGNGHLQLHFMNVGQGDGAVLITPGGQTVMFDNGPGQCSRPIAYMQQLGVTRLDYHVASHYHADHIGCTPEVLAALPLQQVAFDRGGSYTTQTYTRYVTAVGSQRQTAPVGSTLALEGGVSLDFLGADGAGVPGADDENDRSVAVRVRYGSFDALIAGDLSGMNAGGYADVESVIAPIAGQVEVYKVNHHGSRYSSNATFLATIAPKVGILSVGASNSFSHPAGETMSRLHAAGIQTYWTTMGNGVAPDPFRDFVGGDIVVNVPPSGSTFTVGAAGKTHSYTMWGEQVASPGPPQNLAFAVSGDTATFMWQPPSTGGVPGSYILEASLSPGGSLIASMPVTGTSVTVPNVPNGVYYVWVRALNSDGTSSPSNGVVVVVPAGGGGGCTSAPNAPQVLSGGANGDLVTLAWSPPSGGCTVASYSVHAGSAPGASDLALMNVGTATTFSASAPPGTYYVRVVALNAFGGSLASNEIIINISGGCTAPPNAPQALSGSANGSTVLLNWAAPSGGCAPTSYAVHAGSAPGQSNVTIANVGAATGLSAVAPGGTYYVRVIASNTFGPSLPSNEVIVTVICQPPASAPMLLAPSVSGSNVTLNWVAPGGALTGYVVEAGSSPGGVNLLNTSTGGTSYSWNAPVGTHYIRVRAINSCGTGPASNQVTATVAGSPPPPNTCGPTSAPCGQATARCNDGTYSCSQNRSGTCSSHGGVSCWICPGRLCSGDLRQQATDLNDFFGIRGGNACGV